MLRIVHVEEIADLLLRLPSLVEQQDRSSAEFIENAGGWLRSLEDAFSASRLYQAGSIATLRSGLIAVEQGQIPPGIAFRGRPSRWRVSSAAASQALQRAAEIASAVIAENQPRIAEAERVAQQIIAAAASRGQISSRDAAVANTQDLQMLRVTLTTSEDLQGAIAHLDGLVGPWDALVVLDRALASHFRSTSVDAQPAVLPSDASVRS